MKSCHLIVPEQYPSEMADVWNFEIKVVDCKDPVEVRIREAVIARVIRLALCGPDGDRNHRDKVLLGFG